MSMVDSFFAKGFKAAKCKTLLKLTIPRIKLLRNRRENQLKQMRREIAKLLETGQEATARIRVEHIIREQKMMAAQEIVELFSELISVRLPIIETQRECPLDLKEAISSVCFAAPRCADLPELQQVHMLFAAKYGKEFVAAASELRPECGVNRQLVELLSVRAPDPEIKLKLLKDIAEEHEVDWDPAASESELLKPHEDLLNGPTQFVSGSKLPLPEEKRDESTYVASKESASEESNSDDNIETMDFPEVPKASVRTTIGTVSAPEMLPFPGVEFESTNFDDSNENSTHEPEFVVPNKGLEEEPTKMLEEMPSLPNKQFLPFISPPLSSMAFRKRESEPPQPQPRMKSEFNVDLQDVLAAAQAAAESAERAASAARSAATLAQVRINELIKKRSDEVTDDDSDNPFHVDISARNASDKPHLYRNDSSGETIVGVTGFSGPDHDNFLEYSSLPSSNDHKMEINSSFPSYDDNKVESESPQFRNVKLDAHQPQRLPSMDDEYLSYPNLFNRQDSNIEPSTHYMGDSSSSK